MAQALQAQAETHRPRPRVLGVGGAVAHVPPRGAPGRAARPPPDELAASVAEQLLRRLVDELDAAVAFRHHDPVGRRVEHLGERARGEPL